MTDELSGADRGSSPPSFDFDDDAIASLLDSFVETQTGPQEKHVSRPPRSDDSGAQAAQRTVFQHASRHEALPLVGESAEAKQRRIQLLEALAARAVGSTRARLLTSAAELSEQLGDTEAAARSYAHAQQADARDVVVLRALRRNAIRREDWTSAADALEKETSLDLAPHERAAGLKMLAHLQRTKLGDAASSERSATRAAEVDQEDFVCWLLAASARLARGRVAGAAEALTEAATRWPSPDGQAVIELHAADLMEQAGALHDAKALFERVLVLRPESLAALLGIARTSRGEGDIDGARAAIESAARRVPAEVATALMRVRAVLGRQASNATTADSPGDSTDPASTWTESESALLRGDLEGADAALASRGSSQAPEIASFSDALRSRLRAELGLEGPAFEAAHPRLATYLHSLRGLHASESDDQTGASSVPFSPHGFRDAPGAAEVLHDEATASSLSREAGEIEIEPLGRDVWRWDPTELHDSPPARWNLEDTAPSDDERSAAAAALAELDPEAQNLHRLRAALWAASSCRPSPHAEAVFDRRAPDPLLLEHLLWANGGDTEQAGELLLLAHRRLGGTAYALRAAAAFDAAGLPGRSAAVLRDACRAAPDDLSLAVRRRDAELRAGELARLADHAMQRVRQAEEGSEELEAFAAMAAIDGLGRRDMQGARLSLQSIAEARPDHIPTARALEGDALRERDPERIRRSAQRLLTALPIGSADRVARRRLVLELVKADSDILQNEVDRLLRSFDEPLDSDPGLARQVLGAAYGKGDVALGVQGLIALQASVTGQVERAAWALEAAHLLERGGRAGEALEALNTAGPHPLALEAEATLLRSAKRWEDAVAAFGEAAARARDEQRAASLWREAACIAEESLHDGRQALEAWEAAALCDIRYGDVYRRLAATYASLGRIDDLERLTNERIDAGADTPTLVGLLLEKAEQRRERGDNDGVIETLEQCLELDPHHFGALRELCDAHRARHDWQSAAESLIRIARLGRSLDEQVWAFSQLAEIYHEHLDDAARAEASLRRAHELAPTHTETLDRLASVLAEQGQAQEAARLLQELVRHARDEVEARDYRIRLATVVEQAGEWRQAEAVFEQLRAERPTDPDVILAMADHYARQGAGPAEAMHLNRAVNDLRDAIDAAPGDETLWQTLVRVLRRRHGRGAASCAASAAVAIGHPASLFAGDVTARAEAFGDPNLPFALTVDDIVAPAALPSAARRLFSLCEQAFDKMLPFDAAAWRLRRPSGDQRGLVEEAGRVAEALGLSEPRLRVTPLAPASCMPIGGDPPSLVVGSQLHEVTTAQERVFLFARALKVASAHLAPALRARPEELDAALLALLRGHDPGRAPEPGPEQMRELRRKLLKAVPKRSRDEVESLVLELRGSPDFSSRLVPVAVSELGDRAALTLTGDVPSAVEALLKITGRGIPNAQAGRFDAIRQTHETWSLVRFAISDAHFEARAQAGVDR